jgi:PelA/Pel-15E family pectate lyase
MVRMIRSFSCCLLTVGALLGVLVSSSRGQDRISRDDAAVAMRKAATFYREKVAVEGGYVYHYSLDLAQRWGEGVASPDQVWVQPPGTPTVGMSFLNAYEATGDSYYLDAAREAAEVLAYGQFRSGGWTNSIDVARRREGHRYSGGDRRQDGNSSLDDGQTQSAIQLVVLVDEALEFKNEEIHESAMMALDALLAAQFANGAFPQVWRGPASKQPVLKASYPDYDWRNEGRIKEYWDMYTLNDNVCGYVADALVTAHRVYGDEKYLAALARLGDFLILAQMPDPQPAWAQQYNYDMHPIWARAFEPPGVSGDESQEAIETLMTVFDATGELKYLEPIPRAIAYLKKSLLPDGRLARYYELKTNRPLYMKRNGRQYELTYDDSDLPSHYGWKTDSRLEKLQQRYNELKENGPRSDEAREASTSRRVAGSRVAEIVGDLDDEGRWISVYDGEPLVGQPKFERGMKYLSSAVFSRNVTILSAYLAATKEK